MKFPVKWRKPALFAVAAVVGVSGYSYNVFERDKARRNADMYAAMARSAERSALDASSGSLKYKLTSQDPLQALAPYLPSTSTTDSISATAPPQPTSATLADGFYSCATWVFGLSGGHSMMLGKVEIHSGAYRGPSETPNGPFQPLPINSAGEIAWSPNFSSLAAAGATIVRSYVTGKAGAAPSFKVDYRNASGSQESMDCLRE